MLGTEEARSITAGFRQIWIPLLFYIESQWVCMVSVRSLTERVELGL